MDRAIDVVVAGAGPVGLLTAIELTLGGARVRVLERLTAPSTTLKALGVGPLGVEALQRRGMGAAIEAAEARSLAAMDRVPGQAGGGLRGAKFSGHFGFLFIRRDPQAEPDRRMRAVDQQGLEAMLIDRAAALGVDLRRGCTLTGFTEAADGVEVTWTAPAGDGRVRCAYLVGCDGGRSAVRKMAGFAFPGTPPTLTMYQAIADLDDPAGALCRSAGTAGRGRLRPRAVPAPAVHAGFQRPAGRPARRPSRATRSRPCCAGSAARMSASRESRPRTGGPTTRASSTPTAGAACCWPATRRMSTRPSAARA